MLFDILETDQLFCGLRFYISECFIEDDIIRRTILLTILSNAGDIRTDMSSSTHIIIVVDAGYEIPSRIKESCNAHAVYLLHTTKFTSLLYALQRHRAEFGLVTCRDRERELQKLNNLGRFLSGVVLYCPLSLHNTECRRRVEELLHQARQTFGASIVREISHSAGVTHVLSEHEFVGHALNEDDGTISMEGVESTWKVVRLGWLEDTILKQQMVDENQYPPIESDAQYYDGRLDGAREDDLDLQPIVDASEGRSWPVGESAEPCADVTSISCQGSDGEDDEKLHIRL